MQIRIKLIELELTDPPYSIDGLEDYVALKCLVRLHGTSIGYTQLPVTNGRCTAQDIRQAVLRQHHWTILQRLLVDALKALPETGSLKVNELLNVRPAARSKPLPLVTVAVCTRDRSADLATCLDALRRLDYPALDLLVVDNAPSNDATERLVRTSCPEVRYVREPRPGLDWARNKAILEARGEIIAYTDDDVVVDPGWVRALAHVFAENPEVMAVTGLVIPYEIETKAQFLFEVYGGFGRGFKRKWHWLNRSEKNRWKYYGTGQYGTGANMAYRRGLFDEIGGFDPALDVGTVTNGGGDLEMFFRVLQEGYTLVYEPNAVVRHRHRRTYEQLRTQIRNNGIGFYSYLVRSAIAYPRERSAIARLGTWWLWWWNIRRLLISLTRPTRFPRDLILSELQGSLAGLGRYQKARRIAAQLAGADPPTKVWDAPNHRQPRNPSSKRPHPVAVRTVNLNRPLVGLTDVKGYNSVRVFVILDNHLLGDLTIDNHYQIIGPTRLREAIAANFGTRLLASDSGSDQNDLWAEALGILRTLYLPIKEKKQPVVPTKLSEETSVSIVVATYDRPDDLRECLGCLVAQQSSRKVEIIAVDNHPSSGLTPPIVAEFPGVILTGEPRQGLSYARNKGIVLSTGDIVIATDDDVRIPPDWLEKLIVPFARPDVMIVTGNVLPFELETPAQHLFERYGGLGRGSERFEVGGDWFESFRRDAVPTWKLGGTANAAFRADIFGHPEIGLLDEALGAGTPTGCSEDTYIFYQALKAGYTIAYEPDAYVWHKHRGSMAALRRQVYNYSKGHVAYHLKTLFRYHDWRALLRLVDSLPRWHLRTIRRHVKGWLRGKRRNYPLWLTLAEIAGNLVGPWSLLRSQLRVRRLGRSQPYVRPSERPTDGQHASVANTGHIPLVNTSTQALVVDNR